ncbi:phage tail spike protein [Weissella kandleri]|uniref:phage tail spike protein n=1 Tax=Weissella kandleri TaxID=1616 RepID=UPI00387E6397
MTPILYESSEVDFKNNGLGLLAEIYNVDVIEQRNGIFELAASYPVNGKKYNDIQVGRIILAKPSPSDPEHAFRIASIDLDISNSNIEISANSITYDLKNNLIKSVDIKEANGLEAMHALQNAMVHQSIFEFYSNIQTRSSSKLSYVNPLEAIAGTQGSILQYWGGEMVRQNKRIAMYSRRGKDNVMTFRLGKNINSLKYTTDTSNLVTKIYPYVKQTTNEIDRFIEGTPVESKNMKNYFDMYIQGIDVSQNITIGQDDTDAQIKSKINAYAKNWFTQSAHTDVDLPDVTVDIDVISLRDSAEFNDKFKELETIGLTDTVTVFVPEFNVDVTAVVNELHYDPIAEQITKLTVGTAKMSYTDYTHDQFDDMQNKIEDINEEATYAAAKLWDTETELDFSTDGIVATDKIDPNALVIFNSAGLGVSQDGGITFGNAITGRGINATAITTGIVKGHDLFINLDTGNVEFQQGRLHSTSNTIDLNIDEGYLFVSNPYMPGRNVLINDGEIVLTRQEWLGTYKDPYLRISHDINDISESSIIQANDSFELNIKGHESSVVNSQIGAETLLGVSFGLTGKNYSEEDQTVVGGGTAGVKISGGKVVPTGIGNIGSSPSITVGATDKFGMSGGGDRIALNAAYIYAKPAYDSTTSASANMYISSYGVLQRSTSASKYKENIVRDVSINDSEKLLNVPLATWDDKAEVKENGESKRYFGMIAEDLAEAGLEYLVTRGQDGEIEGIEYSKVALLLIPIVKKLKKEVEELKNGKNKNDA